MLWLLAAGGCDFPRPTDVAGDGGVDAEPVTGCTSDEDCDVAAPFCLERTCVACESSETCSASRPVCDAVSHDCRNCVKDSECDSGACDLAAGSCVDPSAILYASPAGTPTAPCAPLLPCSLDKAANSVDARRPYIVLLPGVHVANAFFFQQQATICGNDATFNTSAARFYVGESSVEIRDLKMIGGNLPDIPVITSLGSEITLANVTIDLSSGGVYAVTANSSSTTLIRNSRIVHGDISSDGIFVIDQSVLLDSGASLSLGDGHLSIITNNVFNSSGISVTDYSDVSHSHSVRVANNTFVNGLVSCGVEGRPPYTDFVSNIFFNTSFRGMMSACLYEFNLFVPSQSPAGEGNITGDPLFVDADRNDFRLRVGSPAIDAGDPAPFDPNTHDHDGKVRPQGRAPDIGAFEYSP